MSLLPYLPPHPHLSPHLLSSSQFVLYLLSEFIREQEAELPPLSSHATPSLRQRKRVKEKGVAGTWGEGVESKQWLASLYIVARQLFSAHDSHEWQQTSLQNKDRKLREGKERGAESSTEMSEYRERRIVVFHAIWSNIMKHLDRFLYWKCERGDLTHARESDTTISNQWTMSCWITAWLTSLGIFKKVNVDCVTVITLQSWLMNTFLNATTLPLACLDVFIQVLFIFWSFEHALSLPMNIWLRSVRNPWGRVPALPQQPTNYTLAKVGRHQWFRLSTFVCSTDDVLHP